MVDEWAGLRSVTSAMLLTEFAVERGASEQSVLRDTGIQASALRDPAAEIAAGQELALIRNILAELGDQPGLGLLAGQRYHASAHGVWGFAMTSSPDLRSAIEIGLRYADLTFSFADLQLLSDGPHRCIVFDDTAVPADVRRFHLERDLAVTGTLQRDLIPIQLPAVRLDLPFERHPIYETFALAYVGTAIGFDAPMATLRMEAAALDIPLPQGNVHTATLYEQQCSDLIQRRRKRLGVSGRVRQLLVHRGGTAAQAEIAADLNMGIRTLRRRLADEGTTFRELSDETFGLFAEELLAAGLTVEQVATRLGYSSASAFTHAFRSWKGETPGHYARYHRAVTPSG